MKKTCFIYFLLFTKLLTAQNYIDFAQNKLDKLDGVVDNKISLVTENQTTTATKVFIEFIDSLQSNIANASLDEAYTNSIELALYNELFLLDEKDLLHPISYEKKYSKLLDWSLNIGDELWFFQKNKPESFGLMHYLYKSENAASFLEKNIEETEEILLNFKHFNKEKYAPKIAENIVIQNPFAAKKYFSPKFNFYNFLQKSENDTVQFLLKLYAQNSRNSKSLILSNAIYNKDISSNLPDSLFSLSDPIPYLKTLIQSRTNNSNIAIQALDIELEYETLKFIRTINAMHEMHSSALRFQSLNQFSSRELYFLITYTQEEIFTSTFNGLFDKLISKLSQEKISGFQLIQAANFNRFRIFIQMCANFGKLNNFMETMPEKQEKKLITKFVSDIGNEKKPLSAAVNIADAMGDIDKESSLKIIEEILLSEYKLNHNDKAISDIYGLLIHLFSDKITINSQEFLSIANLYHIPPIVSISNKKLLGSDSINNQVHLFYDDEDGVASYHSFLSTFKNSNWTIKFQKEYLIIESLKGKKVRLYVTKPEFEKTAIGQVQDTLLKQNNPIDLLVHRGHSFYVSKSISAITPSTSLVFLGSCGGYHRLVDVLNKSSEVQIISTKQIGSQHVNNPVLFYLSEQIRLGNDVDWEATWAELESKFSKQGKIKYTFQEYIPPHRNLGAKLIQAYNGLNISH